MSDTDTQYLATSVQMWAAYAKVRASGTSLACIARKAGIDSLAELVIYMDDPRKFTVGAFARVCQQLNIRAELVEARNA